MSRIRRLLNQLKESGIHIEVTNKKLKLNAPEGKLTAALLENVKNRKQEIIDFLQRNVQNQMDYASIAPAEEKEYYPLSSAQERMYFLQHLDLERTVYNISSVVPLPGHTDPGKLEITFKKLIHRHESLRTSFEMVENKLVQKINREVDFSIQGCNGIDDFVRSFDLAQAPLLRVGIIESGPAGRILVVDMHHGISDGISLQILTREFMSVYNRERLYPLRLQYRDYAQWQNSGGQHEAIKKQEAFWLKEFPGEIPVVDLPTDYPRPNFQSFAGSQVSFRIPAQETWLPAKL